METKANYILLGAATLVGALLIMLFAVWLSDEGLREGYQVYDVVFDDPVRGLAEGGEVRFNGIKVGEVQSLRIDPDNTNRVIARIRVSDAVPLRVNSRAQLEPIGLTGVTLIQLSAGTSSAALLQRPGFGGPTPRIQGSGSQIDIIVARSEEIVMRASEAMASVRDLLTDENIQRVTTVLNNLQSVTDRLAQEGSVIDTSATAAAKMGNAADSVTALADELNTNLSDLNLAVADLRSASQQAAGTTLPEITLAAEDIRRATGVISRLAEDWEENPSLLTPQSPRPTVELDR